MRLDLLRHGQVAGGRKYRGNGIDDPLSPTGWQALERATKTSPGWQAIHSSPLRRCADFARHLAERTGLPLYIHPDLREVGFGAWEGLRREELERTRPEELAAFYRDPLRNRPAGAEALDQLVHRVGGVLEQIIASEPQHHLLLVHAGVIRAALAHALALPLTHLYRVEIHTARFTTLEHHDDQWRLTGVNRSVPA